MSKDRFNENDLLEVKEVREKFMSRLEVLDKVKSVITLPNSDFVTMEQLAHYYNVPKKSIETVALRNSRELSNDGVRNYSRSEIIEFLNLQNEGLKSYAGKTVAILDNGLEFVIPNRGLKLFTRRAILRVGMLLRDSEVAKEVRTYLLNIEENSSQEQKDVEIVRLNTEDKLLLDVLNAGDKIDTVLKLREYKVFKDSQIKKLEVTNDALAKGILKWDRRDAINRMLRKIAAKVFREKGKYQYSAAYEKFKAEMLYKYDISITRRLQNCDKKNATMFDVLSDEELSLAVKSCVALCKMYKVDISDILFDNEDE